MPRNPFTDPDWGTDLAGQIEKYVGMVRTTATDRVVGVVRALVFSIIIGIVALVAIALVVILGTKLLQTIFESFTDSDSAVWLSYVTMAALLFIGGAISMRQRRPKDITL